MPYWSDYVVDRYGTVIPSATMTVTNVDGTTPVLYSDASRTTVKTQPFQTDSEGHFEFYIASGRYNIQAQSAGFSQTDKVDIGTPGLQSVIDFGAIGDGVTDDTEAIQQAVNAGNVYFHGTFLCNGVITVPSNRLLQGSGIGSCRMIRNGSNGDGLNSDGQGLFFADSGATGSYVSNIQIRDMTLDGQVATLGFAEWTHLIAFSGVKDVLIERVLFSGFRGDGLLLGQAAPYITEMRHTKNVTVQDCIFDGVNSDNRNGISVTDGDGIFIRGNTFRNCTKNSMPGPIDIEAESVDAILKNIDIDNNRIESTAGNGAIIVQVSFALVTQMQDIKIHDNSITGMSQGGAVAIAVQTIEAALGGNTSMDVSIARNTVTNPGVVVYPFRVVGVRGISIIDNTFKNTYYGKISDPTTTSVLAVAVDVIGNMFDTCGNIPPAAGYHTALAFGAVDSLRIHRNTFDAPNDLSAILFNGDGAVPTGANISIRDNEYHAGTSQTHTILSSSYIFTTLTTLHGDELVRNGPLLSAFPARGRAVTSTGAIASGATTAVFTHNCGYVPTLGQISITFGEQATSDYGRWWISAITSTQASLNVSVDPGVSNLDFGWRVG